MTNMRRWELDQQALEEFLVGCKQKEKIFLTLEEEKQGFHVPDRTAEGNFCDQKEHLGIPGDRRAHRGGFPLC